MDNNLSTNTRIYTDIQSLNEIKHANTTNPDQAKKEVAQQFEAILMQMVMSSMRAANKAFASTDDEASSDQMDMYQDMFDKQLSLMMSNSGLGFAKIVEKNMDQQVLKAAPAGPVNLPQTNSASATQNSVPELTQSTVVAAASSAAAPTTDATPFKTPEDFVSKLWSASKKAADTVGLSPEILLAQAALETNWGKNVIAQSQGSSSHNLFNIKADPSWTDKTVSASTLEQNAGTLVREKASFRSYDSFQDSFKDYVNFLKTNDRYNEALSNTSNPGHFINSLQKAGYATDQEYADKVMKIFKSSTFQQAVSKIKANNLSF